MGVCYSLFPLMPVPRPMLAKRLSSARCGKGAQLELCLQTAGVAFAISLFTEKYRVYMESRLYRTQGLKQLLSTYGEQVSQPNIRSRVHSHLVLQLTLG